MSLCLYTIYRILFIFICFNLHSSVPQWRAAAGHQWRRRRGGRLNGMHIFVYRFKMRRDGDYTRTPCGGVNSGRSTRSRTQVRARGSTKDDIARAVVFLVVVQIMMVVGILRYMYIYLLSSFLSTCVLNRDAREAAAYGRETLRDQQDLERRDRVFLL